MGAMKKMLMEGQEILDQEQFLQETEGTTMQGDMEHGIDVIFYKHRDFIGLEKNNEPEYLRWARQVFACWHKSYFGEAVNEEEN
tara:strand:- start:1811 stop:2062 length:252 start_codon:yes stop_codon:yes gene_type:complete